MSAKSKGSPEQVVFLFNTWVDQGPMRGQKMIDITTPANKRPLDGTPMQVKWAKQIRMKAAKELQELGLARICLHIRPCVDATTLASISCDTERKLAWLIKRVIRNCFVKKSSKWWIDNKAGRGFDLLRPSWEWTVALYQKKGSPWK